MEGDMVKTQDSGSVIGKNLLSIYPGAVLYGLLFNISLMIDSVIAGQTLGAAGIEAVALGVPGYGVPAAIIYAFIHGSGLRMIWAKGHVDDREFRRVFRGGATIVGLFGLLFAILIFVFGQELILLCGGDMVDSAVRQSAGIYLLFCAPTVFLTALGMILQEYMNVLGLQTCRAALGGINVGVNLVVSVLCVSCFPADLKLAGLGIGTSAGGLVEFIGGIILLCGMKLRPEYRPLLFGPKEIMETMRCGVPAAADYLAENVVMGIQNNLILSGFPGDPWILSTAEVVCNIAYFASGMIRGAAIAAEPLFGVFYAERDADSIKKVWYQGWGTGLVMSVVWAVLFYVSLPALTVLYKMELSPDISRGMLLCMVFAPVMHTIYMFTLYYEAIKRFAVSMAFAIIPDSCLYVLMMAVLIPVLGKDGIWLAVTGNQLVGLILLIPLVWVLGSKSHETADRLLLLPEEFYSGTILQEFEISGVESDTGTEIGRLRNAMEGILDDPVRTAAVLKNVEELVTVMRRSSGNLHIKLREEGDRAELFIRCLGQRRELPAMIEENSLAKGDKESIAYSFVYKMSIVCITVDGVRQKKTNRNS